MADLADMAQDTEAALLGAALAGVQRFEGVAALDCSDCGEPIEQKRRELLKAAAVRCASCAGVAEKKAKTQIGG